MISNPKRKIYTLEQIHANVEMIQKHYEQTLDNSPPSSCFDPFRQMTKIFKNTKPSNSMEYKSPFVFGGETFRLIALPQEDEHIYENELLAETISK